MSKMLDPVIAAAHQRGHDSGFYTTPGCVSGGACSHLANGPDGALAAKLMALLVVPASKIVEADRKGADRTMLLLALTDLYRRAAALEPVKAGPHAGQLMLIVTELAEAFEADMAGDFGNFAEEIADAVIRILDLCGSCKIRLQDEVLAKMRTNETRPHRHGKKY